MPAVKAELQEALPDAEGDEAVVGVFAEVAVGAALAGSVEAAAVSHGYSLTQRPGELPWGRLQAIFTYPVAN